MTPDPKADPILPRPELPTEAAYLANATPAHQDGSIDLLDLATRLLLMWRTFALWTLIPLLIAAAYIFHLTPLFESDASILPETKDNSTTNVAAYFSGRVPGEVFVGLLNSRSVADFVIDRVGLMEADHLTSMQVARDTLASESTFTLERGNLIAIRVRDKDGDRAKNIANAYVEALEAQRTKMLLHDGELRNSFFEQQVSREADALSAAEQDLAHVQERSGVLLPEAQTSIGLNAVANLRAQITGLQVELSGLLQAESEQNPEVKSLRAQISQLQGQVGAAESARSGTDTKSSIREMPELNLEILRKQRLVKYHETLYSSLSNEYEAERLSAGFSRNPFVIVDPAIKPEVRAWPNRRLLYLLDLLLSSLVGLAAVAISLVWSKIKLQPAHRARAASLRKSFRVFR